MSSKSNIKKGMMTAEMKNAKMNEARDFLTKLLQAAMDGRGTDVQDIITKHSIDHGIMPFTILSEFKDGSKRTAMHFACHSRPNKDQDMDIVEFLLTQCGFSNDEIRRLLSLQDSDGLTPLMLACQNVHEQSLHRIQIIVQFAGHASCLVRNASGATALHYLAGSGAPRSHIEYLTSLDGGSDAIHAMTSHGATPLHWASGVPPTEDFRETLTTLLDLGATVDPPPTAAEQGGCISALVFAAANKNDLHAALLIEKGADRGIVLSGGVTLYHMAADLKLEKTLRALIDADGGMEEIEKKGEGATTSQKCLSRKNEKGETPLDLAAQRGHLGNFMLLSGEKNEEKARTAMELLDKEWATKRKNEEKDSKKAVSEKDGKDDDKDDKDETHPDEMEAKKAAVALRSNPPSVSDEDKAKAAQHKANGNSHYGKKEWTQAIASYTEAIKLNPCDETYYSNRSACYMSIEDHQAALQDAVMTRHLKLTWPKGCYRLSVARLALNRFEDAAVSAWEGLNMDEGNQELEALVVKCVKKGRKDHLEKNPKK